MEQKWQYKIGFSVNEFNTVSNMNLTEPEIENLLSKKEFVYKKIIVEEILRETIPKCLNAIYKNPSSMREDTPNAFSCSSLISYLYVQAGVWMPSLSIDKYVFGTSITKEKLKFGDLVFSNTGIGKIRFETVEYLPGTKVPEGVDHVGMYLGDGNILHASSSIGKVDIEKIDKSKMFKNIVGFRKVANTEETRYLVNMNNKISVEEFIKNLEI